MFGCSKLTGCSRESKNLSLQGIDPVGRMCLRTRLGKLFINLSLTLFSIIFLIVAIEVLLRILPTAIPDSFLTFIPPTSKLVSILTPRQQGIVSWYLSPAEVDDPRYGFRYPFRNVNGYDENGFRNRENYADVDIVALGDSFVHGGDMPDGKTWLHLIEDTHNVKILSIGVGGWSAFQEERAYADFGRGRKAQVVILAFYSNDIGEIEAHADWEQSNLVWSEYVQQLTASSKTTPVKYFVRNYSFIGNFLYEAGTRSYARLRSSMDWARVCPTDLDSPSSGNRNVVEVGILKLKGSQPNDIALLSEKPGFQLIVDSIRRIALMARDDGSWFLVVYIPFREQVYSPLMEGLSPDEVRQLDSVATKLSEAFEDAGIEFHDMTEDFRREANRCVWLYITDGHWNESGHALAAQLLWERIAGWLGRQ